MYKKSIFICLILFGMISQLNSATFLKKATDIPVLIQEGEAKHWCPVCGMKIKNYYKTSYSAKLKMNGTKRQYCSMRCLAVDMEEYGIDKSAIVVVDAKTEKLINAHDAFFVVGSKISGTMSKVSKLAFAKQGDADEFIKKYKGKLVTFEVALKMAQDSLKSDIAMVTKKKKKKIYPRGKRIYNKVCKKESIDPTNYIEINELKEDIVSSKLCKPLKEKDLQAVSLYIWEVKRFGDLGEIEGKVEVREDEKCPVCGMFTYKYPRWAAQIFYKHGEHEHHWSFDGVKDLMKFYFDAQKWGDYPIAKIENITKILVTDYYSQKGIDGTKAFYVIRSDIYGPMGHELIPFESQEDAKTFKKDHFGKKIIMFKDIIEDEVYKLDFNE
ncbi:MAG: nitrous oxide reductase accessory protein NosL [Campylobacterota bacterium]|nr:nitrous oxide reductase accessory protein NosL [Campylobacterota bacterium]